MSWQRKLKTHQIKDSQSLRVKAGIGNSVYLDIGIGKPIQKRITESTQKTFVAGGYTFWRESGTVIRQEPFALYPVAYSVPHNKFNRVSLTNIFKECTWNT